MVTSVGFLVVGSGKAGSVSFKEVPCADPTKDGIKKIKLTIVRNNLISVFSWQQN